MTLGDPIVTGDIRLEPLAETHRQGLKEACAQDQEIWPIYAVSYDPDHFDESFDRLVSRDHVAGFALFLSDRLVGLSCFLNIEPDRGVLENGYTYYVPDVRGTGFNRRV